LISDTLVLPKISLPAADGYSGRVNSDLGGMLRRIEPWCAGSTSSQAARGGGPEPPFDVDFAAVGSAAWTLSLSTAAVSGLPRPGGGMTLCYSARRFSSRLAACRSASSASSANSTAHIRNCSICSGWIAVFDKARHRRACLRKCSVSRISVLSEAVKRNGRSRSLINYKLTLLIAAKSLLCWRNVAPFLYVHPR